jgi:AcrR family transcriptional regulator
MATARERRPRLTPEQQREAILRAAAKEFAERGHREARLEDIAHAAGMTKAHLYDHFADKRTLHCEVIMRSTTDALQSVAAAVGAAERPAKDRFRDGTLASFRTLVERPDVRMMILGVPGAPPEVAKVAADGQRTMRKALAMLYLSQPQFLAGDEHREERAEEVAQGAMGAITGLAILGAERGLSPEHLTDVVMKLVWPGISALGA